MSGLLFLLVYVVGYCVCAWIITGGLIDADPFEPDTESRVLSAALGCLIAIAWPLAIPVYALAHRPTPGTKSRELQDREARIARMERELLNRGDYQ